MNRRWLAVLLGLVAARAGARETFSLDRGWKFRLGDPAPYSLAPAGPSVTGWSWMPADVKMPADGGDLPDVREPAAADPRWAPYRAGDDVFAGQKSFAWFRVTLPALRETGRRIFFTMVDDEGRVALNGRRLLDHHGWNDEFAVDLDAAWNTGGPNVLTVLVGNSGGGPGRIGPASLVSGPLLFQTPAAAATAFADARWRRVDVPHDYVVEGAFDPHGDVSHGSLPHGVGWYRRTFTLPASAADQRVWLEFDGIYRDATIWLDGMLVDRHRSGYTSFMVDVSARVRPGTRHVLAVRCDASENEGWWYEGGGIYRHVRLTLTDPVHVAPWGTVVTTPVVTDAAATVRVASSIRNDGPAPATFTVRNVLLDPAGREAGTVEQAVTLPPGSATLVVQSVSLVPQRWSLETPRLYQARVGVLREGQVLDEDRVTFGIRTIRFDPERGFFLNEKPVKLQGTCNHQDFAGVGVALPDRLHEYKIEELKRWGANAYRCSHHPPAPEILEACDRLGMLVMDENRHLGDSAEILSQVESMVRRDRNHPSIVIWSTCNEEWNQGTELAQRQGAKLRDLINRLDGTRPITSAMNQRDQWGKGLSLVEDVQGTNYNPEGYDDFHKTHPAMPIVSTESHSTTTTRGIYWTDTVAGFVTSMKDQTEYCWRMVAERDFVAGTFVWTGFDYRGEPTPYAWPCVTSHFGFLDLCGFPKDDAYYYKAWWGTAPSVHVFPHWNAAGKERGKPVTVRCYGNTAEVELFVNGTSAGKKPMPRRGHLDWEVPYAPGFIEARGVGVVDRVETTGRPAAIRLTPDRSTLKADGEDVALVRVEIVDAKGRVVPDAMDEINFSLNGAGRIIGVGSGNPSSHESDKAMKRKAFNGRCLAIIQTTRALGELRLAATSPGLKSGTAVLTPSAPVLRPELPTN